MNKSNVLNQRKNWANLKIDKRRGLSTSEWKVCTVWFENKYFVNPKDNDIINYGPERF